MALIKFIVHEDLYAILKNYADKTQSQDFDFLVPWIEEKKKLMFDFLSAQPNPSANDNQPIQLNDDQIHALTTLNQFKESKDDYLALLTGYAGTGKSFLLGQFLEQFSNEVKKSPNYNKKDDIGKLTICIAAPTNKALDNMRNVCKKINIDGLNVTFITVAKLLGKTQQYDHNFNSQWIYSDDNKLENFSFIIIDEISMVGKNEYDLIVKAANSKSKILFVGDSAQLPPIPERGEPSLPSPAFTDLAIKTKVKLNKIVRNTGALQEKTQEIRNNPDYKTTNCTFISSDDGTIIKTSSDEMPYRYVEEYNQNPDNPRIVAATGTLVKQHNNSIRKILFERNSTIQWQVGEPIIIDSPITRKIVRDITPRLSKNDTIFTKENEFAITGNKSKPLTWKFVDLKYEKNVVCSTAEQYTITNRKEIPMNCTVFETTYNYQGYSLTLNNEIEIKVLDEESRKQWKEDCKELKNLLMKYFFDDNVNRFIFANTVYSDFLKIHDNIAYAYAMTVHKAQGTTIPVLFYNSHIPSWSYDEKTKKRTPVFVDNRQEIQYTGLSRGQMRCYAFKETTKVGKNQYVNF
jgi:DNA replication protein DnaC